MCELSKKCFSCKENKSVNDFGKHRRNKDGLRSNCKICERYNEKNPKPKELLPDPLGKICNKCSIFKLANEFHFKKGGKYNLESDCKTCRKIYRQNKIKLINTTGFKKCTNCKKNLPINSYGKNSHSNDGLRPDCKLCIKEKRKFYKPFVNTKKYPRNYLLRSEYIKNRKAADPFFKLMISIRRNIKNSLTNYFNNKVAKCKKTENILGCTFQEFKDHIENQFLPWMTWDNYGNCNQNDMVYNCSWDLDHIIPIKWAKTNDELLALNHWSNFQPLCSKVNRWEKKDKLYSVCNIELNMTIY